MSDSDWRSNYYGNTFWIAGTRLYNYVIEVDDGNTIEMSGVIWECGSYQCSTYSNTSVIMHSDYSLDIPEEWQFPIQGALCECVQY